MDLDLEKLSVEELAAGIAYEAQEESYRCIHCAARFMTGEIYAVDGRYFEAKRAAEYHLAQAHGDRLEALLQSGSRYLQLTGNQKELLRSLRRGESDRQIAGRGEISLSTVRSQRFALREKAKQARMFLALYALAAQKKNEAEEWIPVHSGARMVDERYAITEKEREKILRDAFESLQPLKLQVFPRKEKKKVAILIRIAEEFERGRVYTEPEINAVLRSIHPDFATLRRYLVEYGFMDRTADCREYRLR